MLSIRGLKERERQRRSKDFFRSPAGKDFSERWAEEEPDPRKPRAHKSTAHPYGGQWGTGRWPWNPHSLPADIRTQIGIQGLPPCARTGTLPRGCSEEAIEARRLQEEKHLLERFAVHKTTKPRPGPLQSTTAPIAPAPAPPPRPPSVYLGDIPFPADWF